MAMGSAAEAAVARTWHDVVAVGGSAGALEPMLHLVQGLPADYPGTVLIVSHIGAHLSHLPQLLDEASQLPVRHARHEEFMRRGHVYIAPPDRHLLVAGQKLLLSSLPREHFTRPAVDPLFRSAARIYGSRVVGVVLSGTGSDGALGLGEIARAGGVTVVQDPAEANFAEMPQAVLHAIMPHHVVASSELGALLVRLIEEPPLAEPATEKPEMTDEMDLEEPFALTCPECGGAVHEIPGTGLITYRCHTGHRFSADELRVHQVSDIERAVMIAVRVLSERTALCRRMIEDAKGAGRSHGVVYWTSLKREADDRLKVLQQFLHLPTSENGHEQPPKYPARA